MYASYIPATDALLLAWLVNFSALVVATPVAYGLVAGDVTTLAAKSAAFDAALTAATEPATRTSVTVAAKDQAKRIALAYVRPLAIRIASNPAIVDELKVGCGVTVRAIGRAPIPAPVTFPILAILSGTPLQLQLASADSATPLIKAKPFGAIAMQVYGQIGTVQPAGPEACRFLSTQTKTPFSLDFAEADKGKTVWLYARWVTRTGKTGPWSALTQYTIAG